jgi:flavodoxin
MNIAIRYFTKSKKGNTAKLANTIAEALALEPITVDTDLEGETDILFLVNAMYAANIDKEVKRFLERNATKIKCLVNVNSSASGASTLKVVSKACKALNIPVSEKEYHTVGSWIFLNKGRPNDDDLTRLKEFAKAVAKGE